MNSPFTGSLKPGSLVVTRFHPATGSEIARLRPAIVLNSQLVEKKNLVIVCPLSSQITPNEPLEYTLKHSKLKKRSAALCWYLRTIDTVRITQVLGQIEDNDLKAINKIISSMFSIN